MRRKDSKPKSPTESAYQKRQRRQAERIIAATGCYSAAFRAEVQAALDSTPYKLPILFREAAEIDKRLELAGSAVRSKMRNAGLPIGRRPRKFGERTAEMIEALMLQNEDGRLDENWSDRATLISNILFDIGNETQVNATHPRLIKLYYLTMLAGVVSLDEHSYRTVQKAFQHVRELLDGCDDARAEQIDKFHDPNLSRDEWKRVRAIEYGDPVPELSTAAIEEVEEVATPESRELVSLRQQLAELERLPENEAVRLQLETEIYNLENALGEDEEEWPDVIGDDGGHGDASI